MKKNALKYFIDALLFIDICAIAIMGLLLAFVIPRGKETHPANYFLGLQRHDWGNIHLCLSIFLLALLTLHLWLNWAWIVQSTKRYFGDNWKNALWGICGAWMVVLLVGWIAVQL